MDESNSLAALDQRSPRGQFRRQHKANFQEANFQSEEAGLFGVGAHGEWPRGALGKQNKCFELKKTFNI